MRIVITIIFQIFFLQSFGQVGADSWRFRHFDSLEMKLESIYAAPQKGDFEFRLWTYPTTTSYTSLFLLSCSNERWSARFFEYGLYGREIWLETPIAQKQLDSLWRRLKRYDVCTLPSEETLKDQKRIYSIDTSDIKNGDEYYYKAPALTDGTLYGFEIINADSVYRYTYASPGTNLRIFPTIREYFYATVIVNLVSIYLNKPMREY